jgi:hypothetical protein
MLVLPSPYDLDLMADRLVAMLAKGVEDLFPWLRSVIDEDELAAKMQAVDGIQNRREAARRHFSIVARGYDDAWHQKSPWVGRSERQ